MSFDAILIPGGGLSEDASPQPWVKARLDAALKIPGSPLLIALSSGTPHKAPPLSETGFPIHESAASALYLTGQGCDPARILLETCSLDTIGNAYFARQCHCEPAGLEKLLVINSEFHMARTIRIFDWIFGLPSASCAFHLSYQTSPDVGLSQEILVARVQKETAAIESMRERIASISTMKQLHRFMFTEHGAYRCREAEAPSSELWAASY